MAEHPEVFDHVGLLVNEPPGAAGCPSFSHPMLMIVLYGSKPGKQGGCVPETRQSPETISLFAGRRQVSVCGAVDYFAVRSKPRAVAGAIPRALRRVPVDNALQVRANGR